MILGIGSLVPFIGNAGIEDKLHTLADQPADMTMGQLGRIAFRFTGNGLDPQFIDLFGGLGRQDHLIAQFLKECGPEGEILIHVENTGNSNAAPGSQIRRQGLIIEDPFIFILKQIGNVVLIFLLA